VGTVALEQRCDTTFPLPDKKQMLQHARQYDSKAVANFVTSIGYSDYAEQFHSNDFSGDALIECTDEDLKDLEIQSALARLKIIILFKRQLQGLNALAITDFTFQLLMVLVGWSHVNGLRMKLTWESDLIQIWCVR